ncbi:MAG: MauE/DoxX family redox-associated membrane protein [Rhodoglobus sp.]
MDGVWGVLICLCACIIVVVFVAALPGKLSAVGFEGFRTSVGDLWPGKQHLSGQWQRIVACAVIFAELFIFLCLSTGLMFSAFNIFDIFSWLLLVFGFGAAVVLLGAFTFGQAVVVRRGRSVSCGCFGRSSSTVGPVSLVRNAILIAVALLGLSVTVVSTSASAGWWLVPAVFAGLVCGLFLIYIDDMVSLFSPLAASPSREKTRL